MAGRPPNITRIKTLEEQVTQLQWCVAENQYVIQKLAQYITLQALLPAMREEMTTQAKAAQQAARDEHAGDVVSFS